MSYLHSIREKTQWMLEEDSKQTFKTYHRRVNTITQDPEANSFKVTMMKNTYRIFKNDF